MARTRSRRGQLRQIGGRLQFHHHRVQAAVQRGGKSVLGDPRKQGIACEREDLHVCAAAR